MRRLNITALFGGAVRNLRFHLDLSQEELAERADLHRTYIAGIERGARNVTLKSIEKLAKALGTTMAALLGAVDSKAQNRHRPDSVSITDRPVEILLVEGNPIDAKLALRALKMARLVNSVHVVHDGTEALDYVFGTGNDSGRSFEHRPRLILLDLDLPAMGGLEVLRRLKADPRTRSISVVVLTGSPRAHDSSASRRLGADAYLAKPVDFHGLSKVAPKLDLSWVLLKKSVRETA